MNLPSPGGDSILPCYLQAYGQCEWKRRERVEETGVYTTPCVTGTPKLGQWKFTRVALPPLTVPLALHLRSGARQ